MRMRGAALLSLGRGGGREEDATRRDEKNGPINVRSPLCVNSARQRRGREREKQFERRWGGEAATVFDSREKPLDSRLNGRCKPSASKPILFRVS